MNILRNDCLGFVKTWDAASKGKQPSQRPPLQGLTHQKLASQVVDSFTPRFAGTEQNRLLNTAGMNCYPVCEKYTPDLVHWQNKIEDVAKQRGLDFYDTRYWVMKRDTLLSTAARAGFPTRYRHWSFGQAYQEQLLPQKHGLANLYELVINNDPCYAYLLEENPLYAQKVVMAHVSGHSDFFKNNYMFQGTYRGMINRMGDHAAIINNILDTERVSEDEMEKFIDKIHSIQWLIDMTRTKPRGLNYSSQRLSPADPTVPEDFGRVNTTGLPPHMDKRINNDERLTQEREAEQKRLENRSHKFPEQPERDVLAFLIEHSQSLKPWQRDVLSLLREESYYFSPQLKTKIMNEGWASYWHTELMKDKRLADAEKSVEIGKMMGNVIANNPYQLNPYSLGLAIFQDIEERWNKGHYGAKWEALENREEREKYDTKEMNGLNKIYDVRRGFNDYMFIKHFFTKDVADKLKMYTWDPQHRNAEQGDKIVISSKQFEQIKGRILDMLENGGQPLIQVADGNLNNSGELQLKHVHTYDLRQDWAETTLKHMKEMWGRPVHLDTYVTSQKGEKKPMRISIKESKSGNTYVDVIKRYILNEKGNEDYECDNRGNRIGGDSDRPRRWG